MKENALTTMEFWDKNYKLSNRCYPKPWLSRGDYELMRMLDGILQDGYGGRLIEMGCGNSHFLPYFGKVYGYRVFGIDFSWGRLLQTWGNLCKAGIGGALKQCDFMDMPRDWRNAFDVVYSSGVVEHFQSPTELIMTFGQLLKPDGMMITTVPHLKGIWGKMQKRLNAEIHSGFVEMDLADIVDCHMQSGFKVVYASYYRWCDFGVLDYSLLPMLLRRLMWVGITFWNVMLNVVWHVHYPKRLPESLYSDMLVVARK